MGITYSENSSYKVFDGLGIGVLIFSVAYYIIVSLLIIF